MNFHLLAAYIPSWEIFASENNYSLLFATHSSSLNIISDRFHPSKFSNRAFCSTSDCCGLELLNSFLLNCELLAHHSLHYAWTIESIQMKILKYPLFQPMEVTLLFAALLHLLSASYLFSTTAKLELSNCNRPKTNVCYDLWKLRTFW